ncbi:MAG: RNA recognition motif-containing protein [Psychromonas sp.]|jgi:RNA recognition motif-containing protein
MDIHVSNIPFKLKDDELKELFSPYGEVESVKIVIDHKTRLNKGYGFVIMPIELEAKKAIVGLNGHTLIDRKLKVSLSTKKEVKKAKDVLLPFWKRKPKKTESVVTFDGQHKKPVKGKHKKRRGHGRGTTY